MNKVILVGRLTRDPDIRYSGQEGGQLTVARYTVAVDRRYKKEGNDQTADFIFCVAFGRQAEFAEKYLHQGIKIIIEGRIQTGTYTNKEGQKVYTTDIIVDNVEFAESKNASTNNEGGYSAPKLEPGTTTDGFMNIPDGVEDEGLPFT